ncbi:hypothetical protein [Alicyclobacillus sp. ALC3]|uniref:hypothetical protein n=1 Tax=Alicyclobacillus sp. ALC3 TaxID=2796143 RepID=UPI002379E177|nr:hypothetical protein [Alicyclobacillus sp. ALC3]WDL96956.1 hypothetical protein JC200_22200 [Alicyclobacillus sp. ALC3]
MPEFWCGAGDILLYHRPPNLSTRLIEDGERLEDPGEPEYFYHVAIALDKYTKIEANGKTVAKANIDYGKFRTFRLPFGHDAIQRGLNLVLSYEGEPYDWPLIIDDGLRYATHDLVHLPVAYIRSEERRRKVCSSLAAKDLVAVRPEWAPLLGRNSSPEDIYNVVKSFPVGA